jgi:hypothetical protein
VELFGASDELYAINSGEKEKSIVGERRIHREALNILLEVTG